MFFLVFAYILIYNGHFQNVLWQYSIVILYSPKNVLGKTKIKMQEIQKFQLNLSEKFFCKITSKSLQYVQNLVCAQFSMCRINGLKQWSNASLTQSISCHWYFSISPQNIIKSEVFRNFQGYFSQFLMIARSSY